MDSDLRALGLNLQCDDGEALRIVGGRGGSLLSVWRRHGCIRTVRITLITSNTPPLSDGYNLTLLPLVSVVKSQYIFVTPETIIFNKHHLPTLNWWTRYRRTLWEGFVVVQVSPDSKYCFRFLPYPTRKWNGFSTGGWNEPLVSIEINFSKVIKGVCHAAVVDLNWPQFYHISNCHRIYARKWSVHLPGIFRHFVDLKLIK
jgi:hypothetical protein